MPNQRIGSAVAEGRWVQVARELGPSFAKRAEAYDEGDAFAAENYAELKAHKVFGAGVPAELGGGGASHAELCAMLRELARHCGSTALALSMHTHLVATAVWRWRHGQPAEPLLRRVAAEEIVLVSTGARDWLESSGVAERVEGGMRVKGKKAFASGAPAGDLLMTSVPVDGEVLHFALPLKAEGVRLLDDWRVLGMRATGSHTVELDGAFVPDAAVALRRPRGVWHPFFNVVATVALPLILSVYLGVAEAARDIALGSAGRRKDDPTTQLLVGEMETALETARIAVAAAIAEANEYDFEPAVEHANAVLLRKTIGVRAIVETVEKALEVTGGAGYFRRTGIERRLRDVHGAQFHPMPAKQQQRFTGRVLLGLDPV